MRLFFKNRFHPACISHTPERTCGTSFLALALAPRLFLAKSKSKKIVALCAICGLGASIFAASLLLAGCSTYQFVTPTARWQTHIGQLQYTSPKHSIIGETVVTRMGDDQFQLDFMTGPGLPILKLRKDGARGRAEAVFAKLSWQGNAGHPPGPLKSWFALHEVFSSVAALPGSPVHAPLHSRKPGFWNAEAVLVEGKPVEIKIEFPRSREHLNFHFSR